MKDKGLTRFSIKKRIKSFAYAISGIVQVIKTEHNFRIHILIMVLVILFGFLLNVSIAEWVYIVFCIGIVLAAEIFNSAMEVLTDLVSPGYNTKAKLVKDMAAGAVLVSAIAAVIVGLIIFVPKLLKYL